MHEIATLLRVVSPPRSLGTEGLILLGTPGLACGLSNP